MNQVDIILRFTARANSLIDSIKDAGVKLEALNAQQRTANINNVLAQNKLGRAAKEVARIEELKLTQERTIAGVNHNISLEKTNIRTLEKQIQNHLDGSVKLTAAKLALVNKELLDSKQILKDEQLKITQLNAQTQILNNQMKTAKQTASERTKSANEFAKAEDKATKAVENQNKALAKSKEELKGIAEQANVHALQQARVVMDGVANGFARVTNEVVRVGNLFQSLRTRLLTSYGGDVQKTEETIAWIKAEAIRTPFQVTEIMGSYARLKMFAGSFKKDTKDMVTVVGDLATAFSQPLPRATQAVADAMNGMYVRLKNGFGITKQMIAAKAKEMTGETVINARGQITDMQAMNTALMAYIEDSSKGAMQRMSNTYKIAVSNLQDAQEALADSMAQVVLPQFRSITLSLTDLVMELNKAPLAYKNLAGGILYSGYAMSQIGQKLFAAAAAGGTLIQAYTAIAHAQALAASSGMKLIGVQSTLISLYTTISRVLPFTLGAAAIATVLGGISLAALETKIKTEEATQALIYLGAKKLHVTDEVKNLDKSVRDLKDSILEVNKTPLQIKTEGSTIPQSLSDNVANTKNVIDTLGTNSRPTALSNIKNTFEKSSVFNKILYDTGEAIYGAFVDLDKAAQRNYFKEKMDNQGFKLTKKPDFSGLNPTYLKEFEREEYAQTPLDITPFTSDENPLMKKSGMKFNNTPIYFSPDKKDPFKRTTLLEGTKNILTDLGENKEQFANYTRLNKLKTDGVELSKKDLETWTELNEKYKIGVELLEKAHTQIKKAPSEQFDSNTGRKKLLSQIEGILKDITVTTNIFQDWKTKAFDMLDKGKSSVVGKGITPQVKTLDNAGKMQTFVKDALKEADIYSKNQGANETGIAFNRLAMLRNMKTYQSDTKDTSKAATFSRNYKMDAGVEVEFDKLFEKEKKKLDVALAKVLSDFKGQKTALVTQADYENYTKQAEHHAKTFENLNNITIEYKESKNKLLFVDQTIIAQDAKAKIIKTDLEKLEKAGLKDTPKHIALLHEQKVLDNESNKTREEKNRLFAKTLDLAIKGGDATNTSTALSEKANKEYIQSISDGLNFFTKTHEGAYKQGIINSRQFYDAQKTYIDTHRKELEKVPEDLAKAETKLNQLSQTSFQDFTKFQTEKLADGKITQADYYKAIEGYMHKYAGEFKDDAERRLAIEKSIADGMKKLAIDTYKIRLEMASKIASGGTNNFQSIDIEKKKAIFALQEEFKEYAKYETDKTKLASDYASRRFLLERDFARKELDERIRLVKEEQDLKLALLATEEAKKQDVTKTYTIEQETELLLKQRDILEASLDLQKDMVEPLIAQLEAGQELDGYAKSLIKSYTSEEQALDAVDDKLKEILIKERERADLAYANYIDSQKLRVAMGDTSINAQTVTNNAIRYLKESVNPAALEWLKKAQDFINSGNKLSGEQEAYYQSLKKNVAELQKFGFTMVNGVASTNDINTAIQKMGEELGIVADASTGVAGNINSMKTGLDGSVKSANELANSLRTINTITAPQVSGLGNFMDMSEALNTLDLSAFGKNKGTSNKSTSISGGSQYSTNKSYSEREDIVKNMWNNPDVNNMFGKLIEAQKEPTKVDLTTTIKVNAPPGVSGRQKASTKTLSNAQILGFDDPVNDAMAIKAGYDTALQTINKSSQDLANYFKAGTVEAVAQYGSSLKTGESGYVSSGMETQSYSPYTIIETGLSEAAKTLDAILAQAKLTTINTEKSADISSDLLLTFEDPKKPYGFLDSVNTNAIISAGTRKETALDFYWEKTRMEKGNEELSREQSIYSAKEQAQKYLQGGIERVKVEEWFTKRRAEIDKDYAEAMKGKYSEVYQSSLARYTEMVEAQKAKDAEKAEAAKALEYAIAEANYRAYEIDYKNALESLDKQKKAYEAMGLSRYQVDEWYQIQKKALEEKYIADKDAAETKRITDKEAKMQEQLDKEATFWSKEDEAKLNRIKDRYDLEDELLRMLVDAEIISEEIYFAKRMSSTKAMLEEYRKIGLVLQENAKQGQYLSDTGKSILSTYQSLGKSVTDLQSQIDNVQISTKIANDNAAQVKANYAEIEKNKGKLQQLNDTGSRFSQPNQTVDTNIQGTLDDEVLKEQTDILSKQTAAIQSQVETLNPLIQAQNEANMGRPTQATGGLSGIGVTVSGIGVNSATVSSGLGQAPQMPGAISGPSGQQSSGVIYTFKPLYGFDNPSNDRMAQEAGERFGTKLVAKSVEDFTNYFRTGMVSGVQTQNILVQKEGYNMANLQSKQTVTMPSGETKQFFSELKDGVAGLLGDIKKSLATAQGNSYNAYIDNKSVKPNGDIKQNTRGLVNSVIASKYYGRSIL